MSRAERRLFPRMRAPATCYATYAEGAGALHDLSLGGAQIEDADPPYVGERFDVTLHLDGERVAARAVVRHREPGRGMGVQLVGFSDEAKVRLRDYVYRLARRSADPAKDTLQ